MFRLLAALLCCAFVTPVVAHNQLGANLNFVADYMGNHEFNDLVKQSRAFLLTGSHFDDANPADRAPLGPDGWPVGDFKLFVWTNQAGTTGLGGTYKLIYNGLAVITATGASVQNQTHGVTPLISTADIVVAPGTDTLFIEFTSTSG